MSATYAIPIICDVCNDAVPSMFIIKDNLDFLFFCDDCTPAENPSGKEQNNEQ